MTDKDAGRERARGWLDQQARNPLLLYIFDDPLRYLPELLSAYAEFLSRSQWVRVEDGLPEQEVMFRNGDKQWTSSVWVLCAVWDGNLEEYSKCLASYSPTEGWESLGYDTAPHVTHWQPLPVGPEEG